MLVFPNDSEALHWKNVFVRGRENNDEDAVFPDFDLTWNLFVVASKANEDKLGRSKKTLRRLAAAGKRAQEVFSSVVVDDLPK